MSKHIEDFIELQQAIPVIGRESTVKIPTKKGNTMTFKYADLPSIHKLVKPIINKHNFMLTYKITNDSVSCLLGHISGESFSSSIEFKPEIDAKNTGAKITYYKRYTLSALLAIDTDDDQDVVPLEQPKKANMSKAAFDSACDRIIRNEQGILMKCLANFDLTQDQHDQLLNLELEHNNG